jgi:hypothetical protein
VNPRQQGDLGEYSAIEWLSSRGYPVFVPIGHSPDVDLVALIDGRAARIQVKTCRRRVPTDRWAVMICTRGGNQSWNGLSKLFSPDRCDYLFVLVRRRAPVVHPRADRRGGDGDRIGRAQIRGV